MSRPRPVPSPTRLVVKNGSKIRLLDLGRDAGAGVADLDQHLPVGVRRGPHGQRAGAAHRVHRVVDQVRPDLVQLGGEGRDPGQAAVVVLDHGDAVADLARQHHQRAVQQLVHVDHLVRGPVQLGVLLGRADQGGDPVGRVLDLVDQQLGLDRVVSASAARWAARSRRTAAVTLASQAVSRPACDERRGELPAAGDALVVQPVGELVLGVRRLHRAQRRAPWPPARRPRSCSSTSGLQRVRVEYGPAAISRSLCRIPATRSRSAEVARTAADGRVVQLVGQPGRQRAERQQPLPLADHQLGVAVPEEQALQQVHGHREPVPHDRPNTSASSTKKRDGSVTRIEPVYICGIRSPK